MTREEFATFAMALKTYYPRENQQVGLSQQMESIHCRHPRNGKLYRTWRHAKLG